jgi:Leucine-rich repeat (LRR) protein
MGLNTFKSFLQKYETVLFLTHSIDIVEIDNLRGMEKLTKLQLDNNIITKIQGLDALVNLKWLDLSFNLITKIEGLDKCTKLTDLSLFKNHIETLSGLENLKELNVLSIGSNKIINLEDTIDYLRKLKNKLEVLRISDNSFLK